MSSQSDRQAIIINTLRHRGAAGINELAEQLSVSHMTVRRDVEELIAKGRVNRYHGGVRLAEHEPRSSYDLRTAELEHRNEKRLIAQRAASLIEHGDTLFFDAGTTTEMIARLLPENQDITVVSTALNIINIAAATPGVRIIATGGLFFDSSGVFDAPEAIELLSRTRITKAFISANAIQMELGVTCSHQFEVACKRAAMRSSLFKILVVDSSKLGHVVSAHFADLADFDRVIVDRPTDQNLLAQCRDSEICFDFVSPLTPL